VSAVGGPVGGFRLRRALPSVALRKTKIRNRGGDGISESSSWRACRLALGATTGNGFAVSTGVNRSFALGSAYADFSDTIG
jgi:hypothetical protein